ncbi:hypothetical protein FHS54_001697 [Sphingobium vermicomposti]|uniref:Uncharacterized protein n=1 Tax=Sphingobium vermicomposti TaxID=529005 RepID=A0A846M7P6_9SPHN|nr:hypothetical protein [Sphingobium vermicomposti]
MRANPLFYDAPYATSGHRHATGEAAANRQSSPPALASLGKARQ